MKELEEKYINLLFHCIKLKSGDILFLEYNASNIEFAEKIINKANSIGVKEIIQYVEADELNLKLIQELSMEELKNHPVSDTSIYDISALMGAKFLRILSPKPNFYKNCDPTKVASLLSFKKQTRPFYYKMLHEKSLIWNIATYPNEEWSNFLFPNDPNSFDRLFNLIISACGINNDNPNAYWNSVMEKQRKYIYKLNELGLKHLHYRNALGTQLDVSLTDNTIWSSISDWTDIIVNMPSYEIFSNLDYRKTEGIVYGSKPLVYNNIVIKDFWFKFINGKVVDFNAKVGYKALKSIIETDELSHYLGEIAIVPSENPIDILNQTFYETTFDENQSCHFSLGSGESSCVKDIKNLNEDQMNAIGINTSSNHVDFMVGTQDLFVWAEANTKTRLLIKNGEWNI